MSPLQKQLINVQFNSFMAISKADRNKVSLPANTCHLETGTNLKNPVMNMGVI